jgi:toxoflavin biosynthesis protein ToxD
MTRVWIALLAACGGAPERVAPKRADATHAQLSLAADGRMVTIPPGQYIAGSTPEERVSAYDDYFETAGQDAARELKWFEHEEDRHIGKLGAYRIDLMPVTQVEYAEFVAAGSVAGPTIDEAAWRAQGFRQDFATQVTPYVWSEGRPPSGHEDHPVVLVTQTEAARYCAWRGELVGEKRRLPTAAEYEKAARGETGFVYPWGNTYDSQKLNSAIRGPGGTTPAGSFSDGASPFGVLELAGNVFQWTDTASGGGKILVKGSAWDDYAGVGRGASGHGRVAGARHVIVGFRCAADAS